VSEILWCERSIAVVRRDIKSSRALTTVSRLTQSCGRSPHTCIDTDHRSEVTDDILHRGVIAYTRKRTIAGLDESH